jgi:luciferase family oxidoreductase group 1
VSLRDLPLSVLDLAPVTRDRSVAEALAGSVSLAREVERLGYQRFWLAEHHNMPGIASSAPAVLLAAVAAATSTIRVGSGGVMLPNHPPLVVAEQFGTLDGLYPGRVDLGIGRAPGTDPRTAAALRRSVEALSADDFPQQLGELLAFLDGGFPDGHPYAGITAVPGRGARPEIWLLGSSGYSAQVAGLLGLPFAFAHHFSAQNTEPALELYRRTFQSTAAGLDTPYAMVCAGVICAETVEEAELLAAPARLSMVRLRTGRPGPLPTVDEARSHPWTEQERAIVAAWAGGHVVGDRDTVQAGLDELLARTAADELMITTLVPDRAARLRSFEMVAELARSDVTEPGT